MPTGSCSSFNCNCTKYHKGGLNNSNFYFTILPFSKLGNDMFKVLAIKYLVEGPFPGSWMVRSGCFFAGRRGG